MISVTREENPTVFCVWQHNPFEVYHDGVLLATHTIRLFALERARERLQDEIGNINRLIQNIHDNTSTELLKDSRSTDDESAV